jgi:hypothetical protein
LKSQRKGTKKSDSGLLGVTKSPFGSAAAVAFFLKRSCSRLVTKTNNLLFTGSHLFSAFGNAIFAKQELHAFFALFT